MRHYVRAAALVVMALLAAACGPAQATPNPTAAPTSAGGDLRLIRVPMGYIPSVQFAPFYVAVEKGYFAEEGLQLEFDYSFETNGVALVGAGELPFAVVSGEQVLLARAQGLPVVYVMAWYQQFPVAVVAPAGSGIETPADLRGKHIGTPALEGANFIGLRALLAEAGIPAEEVVIEAIGFNQAAALTAGQVDAVVVYSNNEPIRLAAQGETLNVIEVADYVALAANGLLTNEATLQNEPELVRGFVRALARGTAETIADPDEAYALSTGYVEDLADETLEKQVLARTIELWQAERLGYAEPEAWENMHTTLLDTGLLAEPLDVTAAYTNDFVP